KEDRYGFLGRAFAAHRSAVVQQPVLAVLIVARDLPGADAVRGDVVRPELTCDSASEADDPELHHRLGCAAADIRRDSGNVDDAAPALLLHERQNGAADVKRAR